MALKVNRIAPDILAETRIAKFVGDDAVLKEFPSIYDTLHRNLRMPDYLSWQIVGPEWHDWDMPRELWLITAHRHAHERLEHAVGAIVVGIGCLPAGTCEEIELHVQNAVSRDLRTFGKQLLQEIDPVELDRMTAKVDSDLLSEHNLRIEILQAQSFQSILEGWAQVIALFVRPEYRRVNIASHLLRIAKRNLTHGSEAGIGLIGQSHASAESFWHKVGAQFYIGKQIPEEEIFAITLTNPLVCGNLLRMFSRIPYYPPDTDPTLP